MSSAPSSQVVGATLPPMNVTGWVNGEPPSLVGKVVVIDAWATWCGPCRQQAPHLKQIQEKYADRDDVVFIGLTDENAETLPAIEKFLTETGISWPNGYGALELLSELEATSIPMAWVADRNGIIVWNDHPADGLEAAIEAALQE